MKMLCLAIVARYGARPVPRQEAHHDRNFQFSDLGDAAETGRTCATGAPHWYPLASLICVPGRGHEWGDRGLAAGDIEDLASKLYCRRADSDFACRDWSIAVPRPSIATPNARVADAFSGIPLNVTTVLTNAGAAFPAPAIETKFNTGLSANAIVARIKRRGPNSVPPSDVTTSQGPMLQVASLEAASPENSATLQQDRPPVASPNPGEGKPSYLKYYVYSEIPPPEKPAKIALSALSNVPGSERPSRDRTCSRSVRCRCQFHEGGRQNRIRFQSQATHRLLYRPVPAEQV